MPSKIIHLESIFKISKKRVIINHLHIVFNHAIYIKLCLCSFLLILVRILWIFVETAISFTVDSNLKNFPAFIIRSRYDNRIFDHLERFSYGRISIEIAPINSNFESCLTSLGALDGLFEGLNKLLVVPHDTVWVTGCSSVNDQIKFSELYERSGRFAATKDADEELRVSGALYFLISGVERLNEAFPYVDGGEALGDSVHQSLTASFDNVFELVFVTVHRVSELT